MDLQNWIRKTSSRNHNRTEAKTLNIERSKTKRQGSYETILGRASQPCGCAVPLSLQFNSKYRIGFCGDWFEGDGFGRIEGSILSALILEKKINDLIK